MENKEERLKLYQKITNIYDKDDLYNYKKKLIQESGKIPTELENLFRILDLKISANNVGIKNIDTKIINRLGEDKIYRMSFEYIKIPPYDQVKLLLKEGLSCSLSENSLKVDYEGNKKDIIDFTKKLLSLLKKQK
jgi:transcription-repair coupling factor (superfamily II helicase)